MKLFSGGPPNSPQFVEDLKLVLHLEEAKKKGFTRWFDDIPNLYPASLAEIAPFASELGMDVDELNRLIGMARFVLSGWSTLQLSEEDLRADFIEAGFNESEAANLQQFFQLMESSREKVRRTVLKRAFEQMASPTIDDVNLVWDIRPIFEDVAYTTNMKGDEYQNLLGKTYVLLFEISASRTDGLQESKNYQLSEEELERLISALQRAKKQLEIIKQKVI